MIELRVGQLRNNISCLVNSQECDKNFIILSNTEYPELLMLQHLKSTVYTEA